MEEAAKVSIDFQDALRNIRIHWLNHIVHEMRGPLFAARGYSKLLLDEKGGPVTATQRKYLETALESINKIGATVDRLQDFQIQEELDLEYLDLFELFKDALARWQSHETLQVWANIAPGPIPTVGDRAKLSASVHKLLDAIVEFSRSTGKIDLQASREGDEFLLRMSAVAGGPEQEADTFSLAGHLAGPCQILRLHGGVVFADSRHPGIVNVTVRLPLVGPEMARVFPGVKGK